MRNSTVKLVKTGNGDIIMEKPLLSSKALLICNSERLPGDDIIEYPVVHDVKIFVYLSGKFNEIGNTLMLGATCKVINTSTGDVAEYYEPIYNSSDSSASNFMTCMHSKFTAFQEVKENMDATIRILIRFNNILGDKTLNLHVVKDKIFFNDTLVYVAPDENVWEDVAYRPDIYSNAALKPYPYPQPQTYSPYQQVPPEFLVPNGALKPADFEDGEE